MILKRISKFLLESFWFTITGKKPYDPKFEEIQKLIRSQQIQNFWPPSSNHQSANALIRILGFKDACFKINNEKSQRLKIPYAETDTLEKLVWKGVSLACRKTSWIFYITPLRKWAVFAKPTWTASSNLSVMFWIIKTHNISFLSVFFVFIQDPGLCVTVSSFSPLHLSLSLSVAVCLALSAAVSFTSLPSLFKPLYAPRCLDAVTIARESISDCLAQRKCQK